MNIIKKINDNTFFKHSKNYLISEFFNKALVFATIPIFTRLLLPEEYGVLSIYTAVVAIFTILMGLNFHGAIARKYYEECNDFDQFLGSNLFFLLVLNIILLLIGYMYRNLLGSFFSISGNLFILAIIVSCLAFFYQLELSYLQASQQSDQYARLSVIQNLATLTIAIIWIYLLEDNRYLGRVFGQLITYLILFVYILIRLIKKSSFNFNINHIKYSLQFGIPLIPHALSGFILAQFDRIIISQISGSYETGIYSFAYNIGMIMNVFVMAMNKSWIPIFYKNLKDHSFEKIEMQANKYMKIVFIISLALILFSKEIVMIMADDKYYKALEIVPIIIFGYVAVFLYTLFSGYTFYRKKTGLISIFTLIAGVVNIILNYIYIPKYGYIAAAWTTLFSYFLLFILHYINARYILKETVVNIKKVLVNLTLLSIFILIYIKFNFNNIYISIMFKIIILLLLFLIYFYKEIKSHKK